MDITQWLEDTAAAVRPKQPNHTAHSPGPLNVPAAATNPVKHPSANKSRRRRRSGADSSILAPEDTPPEVPSKNSMKVSKPLVDTNSSLSDDDDDDDEDDDDEILTGTSVVTFSALDSEPYRRRKRRKTLPDKYDLKPERSRHKRTKASHRNEEAKKKKKSKKSDRRKKERGSKGNTAAAVVRNFNASNVQRQRLTLQPAANLGLFKKGRASSPFKGRGLPDLVFSEINFLQKRKGLHDAAIPADNGKSRRIKDRARQREEEISAYFAPMRQPLGEIDVNSLPAKGPHSLLRKEPLELEASQRGLSAISLTRASIKPIAKPRSAAPKKRSKSASATYFSWSTSVDPRHTLNDATSIPEVEADEQGPNQVRCSAGRQRDVIRIPPHRSLTNNDFRTSKALRSLRDGTKEFTGGGQRSKTPKPVLALDGRQQSETISQATQPKTIPQQPIPTTESLPLPSSPPRLGLYRSEAQEWTGGAQEPFLRLDSQIQICNEIIGRRSSSPLGKLLKHCNACFEEQPPNGAHGFHGQDTAEEEEPAFPLYAEDFAPHPAAHDVAMPNWQDLRRDWRAIDGDTLNARVFREHGLEYNPATEDLGLKLPVEEIMVVLAPMPTSRNRSLDLEENEFEARTSDLAYRNMRTASTQDESVAHGDDGDEDNGLDGFWRPNILY